jgi:DNA polymerase-3 subunit alpha
VKGSGQNAIEAIIAARQSGGPFKDLFDFVKRVDKKQINRRTIEALIRAGAMDCFGVDRGILFASVSFAMDCAEQAHASANQVSLFGGDDSDLESPPEYVKVPPWSEKQRLTEEKLALGFYLSGHLFNAYADEVRRFVKTKLASLEPSRDARLMAGIICGLRTQMTQRGKIMIVTIDDGTATVDVTVYNEVYEPNKQLFKEDEFLAVQGKVSEDRFSGGIRVSAEKVMDIAGARIAFGRQFAFSLNTRIDAAQIKSILAQYRAENGLPLTMRYMQDGVGSCEIRLADEWRVAPADGLKQSLFEKLGVQGATVEY